MTVRAGSFAFGFAKAVTDLHTYKEARRWAPMGVLAVASNPGTHMIYVAHELNKICEGLLVTSDLLQFTSV